MSPRIITTVSDDVLKEVTKHAKRVDKPISAVCREAIVSFLDKNKMSKEMLDLLELHAKMNSQKTD